MEEYHELVQRVLTNGTYEDDEHSFGCISSFHESYESHSRISFTDPA